MDYRASAGREPRGGLDIHETAGQFSYSLRSDSPRTREALAQLHPKAEYWAVVWGTVIMAFTGLLLERTTWRSNCSPKTVSIHFLEISPGGAIVIRYLYSVILDPESYRLDTAFLTGAEHLQENILLRTLIPEQEKRQDAAGQSG